LVGVRGTRRRGGVLVGGDEAERCVVLVRWWRSEDHFDVRNVRFFEAWSFGQPAETFVEAGGAFLGVAVEFGEVEFAEGSLLGGGDEEPADAFALALWVNGHLHELAGAFGGVVGQEERTADDLWAGVVACDGDEVLEAILKARKHGLKRRHIEADLAEQDGLAQSALLGVERVVSCDLTDIDQESPLPLPLPSPTRLTSLDTLSEHPIWTASSSLLRPAVGVVVYLARAVRSGILVGVGADRLASCWLGV